MESIKISVAELRKFKKDSSHIQGNKIIPIYDFIKFEDGTITKNNAGIFVVRTTPPFIGSFLVEEVVLNSFVDNTSDPEIKFTIGENEVVISDSKSKLKAKTADIKDFPKTPKTDKGDILIDTDALAAIFVAVNFAQERELDTLTSYVFVKGKNVSATDRVVACLGRSEQELPELILPVACATKIGGFSNLIHYKDDRYLIFKHEETLYGFIKPDAPYTSIAEHFVTEGLPKFTVDKSDLISFNNVNMAISGKNMEPEAYMQMTEQGLSLSYNDPFLSRENNSTVTASGDCTESFKYWPRKMNLLLKAIPDNEITFHQKDKLLCFITGDSGFTSLIMSLK